MTAVIFPCYKGNNSILSGTLVGFEGFATVIPSSLAFVTLQWKDASLQAPGELKVPSNSPTHASAWKTKPSKPTNVP